MILSDIKEGKIAVYGGNIFYKIINASAQGMPILTIHGGPGTLHDYMEPLAQHLPDHPVVFYDQLGCGHSDQPDNPKFYHLEQFVEDLRKIRAALDLDQFHLLGHSFGTMLAFDYMLTQPSGIASLILASPVLSIQQHLADMQKLLIQQPLSIQKAINQGEEEKNYSSENYNAALRFICAQHLCCLNPWPEIFVFSLKNKGALVKEIMWGPSEFTVYGNLKNYERLKFIKNIAVKTLITCGRYDLTPPPSCEMYRKKFLHAKLKVFENSSHVPHLEEPQQYANALRDFLLEK